jgi:hypothetical protein
MKTFYEDCPATLFSHLHIFIYLTGIIWYWLSQQTKNKLFNTTGIFTVKGTVPQHLFVRLSILLID